MEVSGSSDDGGFVFWSYREQNASSSAYTIGSPSSGTVVSTAYTSSCSRLSSGSMEAATMHLDLDSDGEEAETETGTGTGTETKEVRIKHVKSLVQEFFGAPSTSTSCSINSGDMGVLERWLDQLGVGWIIHVAGGASVWELQDTCSSWTRALARITEAIRLVAIAFASLCPDHHYCSVSSLPSICEKEPAEAAASENNGNEASVPDQFLFARFIEITMLKMLAFVDFIVAPDTTTTIEVIMVFGVDGVPPPPPLPYEKLSTLLVVHGALSKALTQIRLSFHWPPSAEIQRKQGEIVSLLSGKEGKVREAIWNTMEHIRTRVLDSIMEDDAHHLSTSLAQGSSDVHKATRRVSRYIRFLKLHYSSLAPVVSEAASLGLYVPPPVSRQADEPPLVSMIIDTASCLEEKLIDKSETLSDEELKSLFLLNNSYFVLTELKYPFFPSAKAHMAALTRKVEAYVQRYIDVSWAPVLSPLFDSTCTPVCLGRSYYSSPLSKFESEFQKIYTTQKQWKVPHPVLRMKLRKAITDKIIPDYATYIEDNKVITQEFSPLKLEVMLQELFEG